jgi:hypothetical protein
MSAHEHCLEEEDLFSFLSRLHGKEQMQQLPLINLFGR